MKDNKNPIKELEEEEEEDFITTAQESSLTNSSTLYTSKSKQFKYCSLFLKLAGLLIIVGVVLLFALLPNYIQSKNADATGVTDPTNAILPKDDDNGSSSQGAAG